MREITGRSEPCSVEAAPPGRWAAAACARRSFCGVGSASVLSQPHFPVKGGNGGSAYRDHAKAGKTSPRTTRGHVRSLLLIRAMETLARGDVLHGPSGFAPRPPTWACIDL